ncbi:MAG: tetratricopeptide repeat protein [Microcoleus sp.]
MLGKTLNKQYEIVEFLGKGGFGETYIALDKNKLKSQCVVKQLKPKNTDIDTLKAAKKLFDREAKILKQLGHHNQIPKLLAHFEEDKEFYLVEEFIDGNDLKKELEAVKQFGEQQVIALLRDVLEILKFVHQKGVIHRDIKPSNLIRRRHDGKTVLIDFGAVKEVTTQDTSSDGITSFTIAVGTRGYMPNEQQGGKPRFSSDIYALGMTAIHALTGMSPPTPSNKFSNQLQEHSRTGEIIWRQYAQVSNQLAAILDKMVKTHYRDRYDRAEDVLKDIQKLSYSSDTTSGTNFSTIATRKLALLKLPKLKYILVGLAAIGLAIGGSLTIPQFLSSNKSEQPPSPKPSTATDFVKQGNELYNSKKYEEAIKAYDEALKGNPDKPEETWKNRGSALTELQKYEEAVASYDKALAIKSDDVNTLNLKAIALEKLNKLDDAIATYSQALKIDPKNDTVLNNRGVALSNSGKHEEGLKDIEKSLELNPQDYQVWHNKGLILQAAKKYKEAVDAYDHATNIKPELPKTWFNRGDALVSLKKYKEAVYSYDEAIRNKSDYLEAWVRKGNVLRELSRYEDALTAHDKALELQPNDIGIWEMQIDSLNNLKRYDQALEYFLKATKNITPSVNLLNLHVVSLYRLGRYEEALNFCEQILKKDDSSLTASFVWRNKGASLNKLKRYSEALPPYEKSLSIEPSNAQFWFEKGKILFELQQYKEAVPAYDKAIELKPDYQEAKDARKLAVEKQ